MAAVAPKDEAEFYRHLREKVITKEVITSEAFTWNKSETKHLLLAPNVLVVFTLTGFLWEPAHLVRERRFARLLLVFVNQSRGRYHFTPAPVVSGHRANGCDFSRSAPRLLLTKYREKC